MSELVTKLRVIGTDSNIFDTDMNYVIPLYQRAYAWEDKQLIQLVEDISDVSEDANYYIGSLIVSKQNGKYEVVDGQQRLPRQAEPLCRPEPMADNRKCA